MRDIKFYGSFSGRSALSAKSHSRIFYSPNPAMPSRIGNANFIAGGDTVLAQHGQAAYWGAIARVSRLL
jgi:hypothetical protein